jgi:hypothetical protein
MANPSTPRFGDHKVTLGYHLLCAVMTDVEFQHAHDQRIRHVGYVVRRALVDCLASECSGHAPIVAQARRTRTATSRFNNFALDH